MLTNYDQQRIVLMRYGSLTDFTSIKTTHSEIGRRLLIPRPTVVNLLKRFTSRDYCFENLVRSKEKFACIP